MTEKQYAEILDAIDQAKMELLLKLTEIMNEPEAEEKRCDRTHKHPGGGIGRRIDRSKTEQKSNAEVM